MQGVQVIALDATDVHTASKPESVRLKSVERRIRSTPVVEVKLLPSCPVPSSRASSVEVSQAASSHSSTYTKSNVASVLNEVKVKVTLTAAVGAMIHTHSWSLS